MAFVGEKGGDIAYSTTTTPRDDQFSTLEKKDLVYKRRIRALRFASRLASLILAAIMVGILSFSLAKYFLTRNHILPDNSHPWITPTVLWPTFMLLAISIVTFWMNLFTLCTYVCGVGAANKLGSVTSFVGYVMLAVHVVVWAVGVGLFKMANTGHDLWAQSCSARSDEIQKEVQSFMDFGKLCTVQTGAWYISIIEAVAYFLTFIVTILMLKRASHKKKMTRAREASSREASSGAPLELGTVYAPGSRKQYLPVAGDSSYA